MYKVEEDLETVCFDLLRSPRDGVNDPHLLRTQSGSVSQSPSAVERSDRRLKARMGEVLGLDLP